MIAALRELLDVEPSHEAFQRIWSFFGDTLGDHDVIDDGSPDLGPEYFGADPVVVPDFDEIELALTYACEHLEQWPHEYRCVSYNGGIEYGIDCVSRRMRLLRHFDFVEFSIHDHHVVNLAGSPVVQNIMALNLRHQNITGVALEAIANSPHLAKLVTLLVANNGYLSDGIDVLAESPYMRNLKRLDLSNTFLRDSVKALANSPHMNGLEWLDLYRCMMTEGSVEALANSPHMSNLKHLNLGGTRLPANPSLSAGQGNAGLSDNEILAIAHSPVLCKLESLRLYKNYISTDVLDALVHSKNLANLTLLDLGNSRLQPDGLKMLFNSPLMGRLKGLLLAGCGVGVVEAVALARYPGVLQLDTLDLSDNWIGDEGAIALSESRHLAKLERFWVHPPDGLSWQAGNVHPVGERGYAALAGSRYLKDELRKGF